MANLMSALADKISRIARREINVLTKTTKRAAVRYRHDIADLKRQVADLTKRLTITEKRQPTDIVASPEILETGRYRAEGVKAHRAKLGLTAANYGRLVGVGEKTIYKWEGGQSKPRKEQQAKFLAVRGIGKKEAMQRLGLTAQKRAAKAGRKSSRAKYAQTGADFVLSLVKSKKATTTRQINAAWKKTGRAVNADNTLSQLVKAKKLKRTKLKGEPGSRYSVK